MAPSSKAKRRKSVPSAKPRSTTLRVHGRTLYCACGLLKQPTSGTQGEAY